jgi:hypothetical protein
MAVLDTQVILLHQRALVQLLSGRRSFRGSCQAVYATLRNFLFKTSSASSST